MPELRPYQRSAVDHIVATRRLVYADPIGSGKTAVSLSALDGMHADRALVITPAYLLDQWVAEGRQWAPDTEMILGTGTPVKRRRAREKLRAASGPAALVINYESAWRDAADLMALGFDTLICDEAHRLKNRTTATWKGVSKIARRLPNMILVTGTPLVNRADEAWAALHLLWPLRFSSFHRWSAQHFEVEQAYFNGPYERPVRVVGALGKGHAELIRAEFGDALLQRSYADIEMELPDLVEHTITVQLTAAERKAYDELERRSWTRVEGELVQAVNEVSKITRQRQLAAEWGQLTGRATEIGAKASATIQLATDLEPEQVLIVAEHQATVERIAAEFTDAVFIHGETKPSARDIELARFKNGTARVLVATIATVGEGVDGLQCARHLIMVDRPWNPSGRDQVIGRLRRSGQESGTVYVHNIFAENTVDTKVDDVVASKAQVIHSVTGAPS